MLVKDFTAGETANTLNTYGQIGSILYLEMPKNTRGVAQATVVNMGGTTSLTVKLQGRVNSEVDWIDVDSGAFSAITNTGTANTETLTDIQLYPQMRAQVLTNAPSFTVQLYVTIGA